MKETLELFGFACLWPYCWAGLARKFTSGLLNSLSMSACLWVPCLSGHWGYDSLRNTSSWEGFCRLPLNAQAHTQSCAPMSRSAWTQGPTYKKICKYIWTIPAYSHLFSDQGPTASWFNESWHLGKVNLSHWLCFRCRICPEPLLRNKAPHSWLLGSGFVWPQLFLSRHPQLSYQRPCLATQTAKATQQPLEKTETSSWVGGGNDDALLWRRKTMITPTRS